MIIRVIAIMAAAFLLTGCGKKTESPSTAAPPEVQPAPVQNSQTPAPGAGHTRGPRLTPVVAPGTNAAVAPDLDAMSTAVRVWIRTRHQVPKTFEEWAATPNYACPPPPPGKKYALDNRLHVVLVNR